MIWNTAAVKANQHLSKQTWQVSSLVSIDIFLFLRRDLHFYILSRLFNKRLFCSLLAYSVNFLILHDRFKPSGFYNITNRNSIENPKSHKPKPTYSKLMLCHNPLVPFHVIHCSHHVLNCIIHLGRFDSNRAGQVCTCQQRWSQHLTVTVALTEESLQIKSTQ